MTIIYRGSIPGAVIPARCYRESLFLVIPAIGYRDSIWDFVSDRYLPQTRRYDKEMDPR